MYGEPADILELCSVKRRACRRYLDVVADSASCFSCCDPRKKVVFEKMYGGLLWHDLGLWCKVLDILEVLRCRQRLRAGTGSWQLSHCPLMWSIEIIVHIEKG